MQFFSIKNILHRFKYMRYWFKIEEAYEKWIEKTIKISPEKGRSNELKYAVFHY